MKGAGGDDVGDVDEEGAQALGGGLCEVGGWTGVVVRGAAGAYSCKMSVGGVWEGECEPSSRFGTSSECVLISSASSTPFRRTEICPFVRPAPCVRFRISPRTPQTTAVSPERTTAEPWQCEREEVWRVGVRNCSGVRLEGRVGGVDWRWRMRYELGASLRKVSAGNERPIEGVESIAAVVMM